MIKTIIEGDLTADWRWRSGAVVGVAGLMVADQNRAIAGMA